ncbi:SLC13 family permease, partial [Glutamicibacter sp. BSL13]
HLVIQSRSARSAVLIPLVISLAPGLGVNAVAIAFASTAAAGFCHTLTSSAKPVNLFSDIEDVPTYTPAHLLRLSAVLGPLMVLLVVVFAFWVWPAMGLPLML